MSASWWAEAGRWICFQRLEPALTNRWKGSSLSLLTKGRAYLSHAWEARGIGYANTVSGSGWKLMAERLDTVAGALEEAWSRDPHDVRICQEMMRVELGQAKGRERLETWFRRGMETDPASYDICFEKMEYLRPRWYGSINEMIDFGRACTKNTNWVRRVRLMLADAHFEASKEIHDDGERAAYPSRAGVWSDIQYAFNQFFWLYPDAVEYRQDYIRYAYWCGQWQEVLNQVRKFPTTNYAFYGGVDRFEKMLKTAEEHVKSQQ